MSDGFAMELCGNKAAWQIVPEGVTSINLSGPCDLTLYPSGKLLVKTEDKELAATVAEQHVSTWALA